MKMFQTKKLSGFTLIELMIVVAIIGILAAVAIPKFAELVSKSKEASTKGNLGAVRSAVSIYYGDTEGGYPQNLFTGLTTNNKYMPSVEGAQSLGKYTIPRTTTGNTGGHESGQFRNLNNLSGVLAGTTASEATAVPLYYNSADGSLNINCTHETSKGVSAAIPTDRWSSY